MLIEFRFQNFRLFKDEQILSFVASPDNSLPENVRNLSDSENLRILRSGVIFGANASGKTTILDALAFTRKLIKYSAKSEPDDEIEVEPFLFDEESKSAPTSFEFTILQNGVRYQYGFSVTNERVIREWLISYPKGRPRKLFERWVTDENKPDFVFSSYLKGEKDKLIEVTRDNALFLSVGATFNNAQLLEVYRWFADHLVGVRTRNIDEQMVFRNIAKNPSMLDQIKNLISYADLGIVDLSFTERDLKIDIEAMPDNISEPLRKALEAINSAMEELKAQTPDIEGRKIYNISMTHSVGKKLLTMPWKLESSGTRQLLCLSAPIFESLSDGDFIFIDEFDNSLHPLLLRELIKLFHDPVLNTGNAQLLFNTHDTTLLSTPLLRRDQIWFVEKDQYSASHLYSLVEYSPRKDEAFEKGYLQGRYGAVPFFGEFPDGGKELEQKKEII